MDLQLSHRVLELPLAAPIAIAGDSLDAPRVFDATRVVYVAIRWGDSVGWGECAPYGRFGESVDSVCAFLDEHGATLGSDPFALEEIEARLAAVPGDHAAKSGIDAALHDLLGKLLRIPSRQLLGLPRPGRPTGTTIPLADPDTMARHAAECSRAFSAMKLKLGGGDGLDLERAQAVRARTNAALSADVNEGWELDETLELAPALVELGVTYIEQPLAAHHEDGPTLHRRCPLPVYADEDCRTLADVARCAQIADGINIKLAKAGGIREALRMIHAARALQLDAMLGCMLETGLGIAAGCLVAPLCDHVDLDSNLLLAADPCSGVELRDGIQTPDHTPGLGVTIALDTIGSR